MISQLINSVIRGFGFTIGSRAATSFLNKKSKKEIEIEKIKNILINCKKQRQDIFKSFNAQKITNLECNDLLLELDNVELKAENRIKELEKKSNIWFVLFLIFIGVPIILSLIF